MDNLKIDDQILKDANEIAHINLSCWKKSYKDIINKTFLDNLNFDTTFEIRKNLINQKRGIHLVASIENKIVGFSDAGMFFFKEKQTLSEEQKLNRKELGEIYAIYIDPKYQNKGIGEALFLETKNRLLKYELNPFLIWTLKDNHIARIFYEKQGGIKVDEILIQIGDHQYVEVGYQFT